MKKTYVSPWLEVISGEATEMMAVLFGNNATGIFDIKNATDTNATIYDLSGHRVEKVQRGIYIVNGKKVLK